MPVDIPHDLIEIHDPELNLTALMAQIRERVEKRRAELGYPRRTFPTYDLMAMPTEPTDVPYDPNLYFHLRCANQQCSQVHLELSLPPSFATRLPLLGKVWQVIRPALHELILVYVNNAMAKQVEVNRHLVSVLNHLTLLTQDQQRVLQELQAEMQVLKAEHRV